MARLDARSDLHVKVQLRNGLALGINQENISFGQSGPAQFRAGASLIMLIMALPIVTLIFSLIFSHCAANGRKHASRQLPQRSPLAKESFVLVVANKPKKRKRLKSNHNILENLAWKLRCTLLISYRVKCKHLTRKTYKNSQIAFFREINLSIRLPWYCTLIDR